MPLSTQRSALSTHYSSLRWLAACGVGLLTTMAALGQAPRGTPAAPPTPAGPDCLDQPTYLPPLLRPPCDDPNPPLAVVPRGPTGEYDHGHLYLPDYVPSPGPEACRPLGRWWVSPTLELAWLSSRPAPGAVRLRVPDGAGGSFPGPILPIGTRTAERFQAGFGLNVGRWFDDRNTRGLDASLFFVSGGDHTLQGYAPEMVVLFPGGTDGSAPQVLVFPPNMPITGLFPFTLSSWFITTDVSYRRNLYCGPNVRLDALAGYRFAFLQDEVFLGKTPDGSHDDYRRNRAATSNPFHGGQIGLAGEYRANAWYVGGAAKVALGVVTPDVSATGMFVDAEGATPTGSYARLAALTDRDLSRFAVLPSVNVTLGRQVTDHARLFVGYSFQYLNHVARLGDVLNPAASAPVALTDFWVQSLNLGFELRY